jgi:membrane dipeptidase
MLPQLRLARRARSQRGAGFCPACLRPEPFLALLVVAQLLLLVPSQARSQQISRPARFGVIDLHVDLSYQAMFKGRDLARGVGQYDASWLKDAGIDGIVFPLFVPRDASKQGPLMEHLDASYEALESKLPGLSLFAPAPCQGTAGQVDAFYAFEGSAPLGRDLDSIFRWAKRGVRFYGLVHSEDNLLAGSAGYGPATKEKQTGLTEAGRELVRRIHATRGMVDVSHASDAAFADILVQATADAVPLVATHSNARAIAPHARNLSDAQLRAIAATGGIVGINFHSPFLLGGPGQAELSDVVRHIRHVADVAGIDTVAIGSDFEGGIRPPAQLRDVRNFPVLAQALLDSGFSALEVQKIFSLNARRLLCPRQASTAN